MDANQVIAFRKRLLETEKQFYWSQFNQGTLTGQATTQLVTAVDVALDGNAAIAPRKTLFEFWKTPSYIRRFYHIPFLNQIVVNLSFEHLQGAF